MSMNSRLKFTQTGPEAGDCTAPYSVELDKECRTLVEFLKAILEENPNEWGKIYLMEVGQSWLSAPYIEYRSGEIVATPEDTSFKNRTIECVAASGGWSRMDYYVRFKASEEGTKEPAEEERRDDGEATKEQQRREKLEKNIAESIRAVAEHVLASADTYAMGVSDDARGIEIKMTFNIDALPTVTFTQDACPRTWINAVRDGRCRIWTKEGRSGAEGQGDCGQKRRMGQGSAGVERAEEMNEGTHEGRNERRTL